MEQIQIREEALPLVMILFFIFFIIHISRCSIKIINFGYGQINEI